MLLALPQVTLVAIDTRTPALAAQALLRSAAEIDFGRVVLFTGDWLPRRVVPGLELVQIAPITSEHEHSQFVLRQLPGYIRTSHALLTRWDAFVRRPQDWSDEFLVHDYIGAVWPDQPAGRNVGAGAFSLRSRRMLAAGQDPRIASDHPEDAVLCRDERQRLEREHGILYAPPALARRFASHGADGGPAFGFSGAPQLASVLDEAALLDWLPALPDDFVRGRDAAGLLRALVTRRRTAAAQALLARRRALGCDDAAARLLAAAAAALGRYRREPRS